MGSAYLAGIDGRRFHDKKLVATAASVLDQFVDAHSTLVGIATRDDFHHLAEDEERQEVLELFQWYRSGSAI